MLARSANRVLIDMQPAVALIGAPFRIMAPWTPDCNAIETDQEILGIPYLGESGFDIRNIPDEPLSRAMTNAVTRQNRAMYSCRPAVIIPGINLAPVNARSAS